MPKPFDTVDPIHNGMGGLREFTNDNGEKYIEGYARTRWGFVIIHSHESPGAFATLSVIWDGKVHRRTFPGQCLTIDQLETRAQRFAEEVATELKF